MEIYIFFFSCFDRACPVGFWLFFCFPKSSIELHSLRHARAPFHRVAAE